jgi:penicillin-binding protein 1A
MLSNFAKLNSKHHLQIYSRDKKLISEFGEKHSRPLRYNEVPPLLVHAF